MAYRKRMSKRANRRNFRRGTKVKKRNFSGSTMRGGTRL